ncbi:DUF4134 domain-containing protein [Prevotella histicola]
MELNFKFNPFDYVAIKRTSNSVRKESLEFCEAAVFEISSGCMYVHPEYRNSVGQQQGAGGFSKATTEISSYQTPVSNLMKAIAAVIVLVGAFNVYFKMQNGDQDVKKTIMLTIGGCVAFIAMSEALPLFFK